MLVPDPYIVMKAGGSAGGLSHFNIQTCVDCNALIEIKAGIFDESPRVGCYPRQLTPAEAQETFADEPRPHFPNDGQVGLPRLRQDPAEGCQEEEMQEGGGHSAQALEKRENKGEMLYRRGGGGGGGS